MIWLLGLALAGDDCPRSTPVSAIDELVSSAEHAYADLDEAAFFTHTDELLVRTPCLDDVPSEAQLARFHRVVALRLYGSRRADALAALATARHLQPDLGVAELVGPEHPLAASWASDPVPDATQRLRPGRGVVLHVDGSPARARPLQRATLLQVESSGQLQGTTLLFPDDPLPPYPAASRLERPLQLGALGAAALAATSFGLATHWSNGLNDPGQSADQLRARQLRTNGAVVASGVLGAVAVGALVVSVPL
jgi:hypothetical protein